MSRYIACNRRQKQREREGGNEYEGDDAHGFFPVHGSPPKCNVEKGVENV